MAQATKQRPKTKTFAGRIDADTLDVVEAITQRDAGISYGQFCVQLANDIKNLSKLPEVRKPKIANPAAQQLRDLIEEYRDHPGLKKLAQLSDQGVRDMVRNRDDT